MSAPTPTPTPTPTRRAELRAAAAAGVGVMLDAAELTALLDDLEAQAAALQALGHAARLPDEVWTEFEYFDPAGADALRVALTTAMDRFRVDGGFYAEH